MKLNMVVALTALGVAAFASAANAAPLTGYASTPAAESGVIKVHARHRACKLGRAGWHRSPRWRTRVACRPPRPRGLGWIWRQEGKRHGWYHGKSRRWH